MRMMAVGLGLILALGAFIAPSSVEADADDIPAICNTTREVAFFALGVRKGRNLAASAIARVGGGEACDNLDALDELREIIAGIVDDIVVPVAASEVVQCHVLGQVAGLVAAVEELQEICGDVCIADGEFIGQVSAFLYCELAIALDGLVPVELFTRLATDACGVRFQVACDNAFEETSTGDPLCLPFTEGVHTEVFIEVQNNQCADNPDDT
jgi:hypothetical protein